MDLHWYFRGFILRAASTGFSVYSTFGTASTGLTQNFLFSRFDTAMALLKNTRYQAFPGS